MGQLTTFIKLFLKAATPCAPQTRQRAEKKERDSRSLVTNLEETCVKEFPQRWKTACFIGLLGLDGVNHGCFVGLAQQRCSLLSRGLVKGHSQQMKGFLSYIHRHLPEVFVTIRSALICCKKPVLESNHFYLVNY